MAQFTTSFPHADHVEAYLSKYPQGNGRPVARNEEEAKELASEKFKDNARFSYSEEDYEISGWILEVEHLDAYEIWNANGEVIGWEVDSI